MIYGAIANGGYLLKPQIIKEIKHSNDIITTSEIEVIRKVANKEETDKILEILLKAVTEGTGTNAKIDGTI